MCIEGKINERRGLGKCRLSALATGLRFVLLDTLSGREQHLHDQRGNVCRLLRCSHAKAFYGHFWLTPQHLPVRSFCSCGKFVF